VISIVPSKALPKLASLSTSGGRLSAMVKLFC
jgi:hypothetical protein